MIEKFLELLEKKEIKEIRKERDKYRELLLFNLRNTDRFIEEIESVINSEELYYDQKEQIKELLQDFKEKKL